MIASSQIVNIPTQSSADSSDSPCLLAEVVRYADPASCTPASSGNPAANRYMGYDVCTYMIRVVVTIKQPRSQSWFVAKISPGEGGRGPTPNRMDVSMSALGPLLRALMRGIWMRGRLSTIACHPRRLRPPSEFPSHGTSSLRSIAGWVVAGEVGLDTAKPTDLPSSVRA